VRAVLAVCMIFLLRYKPKLGEETFVSPSMLNRKWLRKTSFLTTCSKPSLEGISWRTTRNIEEGHVVC
jgi:hypothetical protein